VTKQTQWLNDAILYEIYPQSFLDSNGDGIGDLPGAISKLDYLQWLGINTVWFNPCFESPFLDAGYDVADYIKIAPRYGTNADMERFVAEAGKREIRVLLDLVIGHTSWEHQWFVEESNLDGSHPLGDRFIWSENPNLNSTEGDTLGNVPWVRNPGKRPGFFLKNFFESQPALNFGYARMRDDEPWRQTVDAPGPRRNVQSLKDILKFWFDRGVAGFRVDMAFSLVKDDEGLRETNKIWREVREWMDVEFPDRVLLPEGVEPLDAPQASFDGDFFLVIGLEHGSLFDNGGAGRFPWREQPAPFFGERGEGSTEYFVNSWKHVRSRRPDRPIVLATADHDFSRMMCGSRTPEQYGAALTFLFTWGSIPSIYYGEEIGMRYLNDLPNHEGSVCHPGFYNRAGVRTPMQWDNTKNAGFSTAFSDALYLPIDPDPKRPNVEAAIADPSSPIHLIRQLVEIRRATPSLGTYGDAEVIHGSYPLVFKRGEKHLVVINPRRERATIAISVNVRKTLLNSGVEISADEIVSAGFSYAIIELN
jgi:maltose alpha-D-glucosyltransferase/alpha-amylase